MPRVTHPPWSHLLAGQGLSLLIAGTGVGAQALVVFHGWEVPGFLSFLGYMCIGIGFSLPAGVRGELGPLLGAEQVKAPGMFNKELEQKLIGNREEPGNNWSRNQSRLFLVVISLAEL